MATTKTAKVTKRVEREATPEQLEAAMKLTLAMNAEALRELARR